MVEQMSQDPVALLLSEFGTRLNEIEEKQRLLKDRTLLVGENLIALKEDSDKEMRELRRRVSDLESDTKEIKNLTKRIIDELKNFARKTELAIIERQVKIMNPIEELININLKEIIREELRKSK